MLLLNKCITCSIIWLSRLPLLPLEPSWSIVVLWHLLSSYYFYCTGHQATIPSIRFEAAFVGFPGDMENLVLPGMVQGKEEQIY